MFVSDEKAWSDPCVHHNFDLILEMIHRPRHLNRSQTGPVPLGCERTYGRSVSASGATSTRHGSSDGNCTPVMYVKPREPSSLRPQSQSVDSGVVSLASPIQPACSLNPMPCSSEMLRVHEFIFLGNADAAVKMKQNCQQNIHYYINVSEKATSTMKSSQSCTSLDQATQQSGSSVVIPFRKNMPVKELFQMFVVVNDIIRQARNKAQRVLLFSEDGLGACLAFALAYNIQYYRLDLTSALSNFDKLKFKIEVDDFSKDVLIKWAAFCEEQRIREMSIQRRTEWKEKRPATVDSAVKRVAWQ
ncbi:Dual specificity phosphatase catalytic domain protein [Trichostrongylus colubriformis]|uniref:Dual specificity phosphatase catalytic domain protein n=1 Tax=Trichostrongylus colubriformis TaxID=6319 RepID=A0AAN8FMJ3_TRICO